MTAPARDASRGVLYIAQGARYLDELRIAASSLRRVMPDLPCAVMTNEPEAARAMGYFDLVLPLDDTPFSWAKRIRAFRQAPFDRTLFLDTDTYVCGDLSDMFRLLDRFEIAVAHAPIKHSPVLNDPVRPYVMPDVPETFPEISCGLLLFRRGEPMQRLLDAWLAEYERQLGGADRPFHDQPSFGKVLYDSDMRVAILPDEYHCWFTAGGYLSGPVCILHGHAPDLDQVARSLNAYRGPRVFWFNRGRFFMYPSPTLVRDLLGGVSLSRAMALLRRITAPRSR